ncbi:hypothetical protein STENM327S_01011 [Streptomyces tendae]
MSARADRRRSINPGNSGPARRLDAQGNVIGISSAIQSSSNGSFGTGQAGSIGLGFAGSRSTRRSSSPSS